MYFVGPHDSGKIEALMRFVGENRKTGNTLQSYKVTKLQSYKVTKLQSYKVTKLQRYLKRFRNNRCCPY